MKTVVVQPGQGLEDVALQVYGSVDGVALLVFDNEAVCVNGFSTVLVPGTVLSIRSTPLNEPIHDAMMRLRIIPASAEPLKIQVGALGDYNEDYNDDHFNLS